jgi:hypothetical protein
VNGHQPHRCKACNPQLDHRPVSSPGTDQPTPEPVPRILSQEALCPCAIWICRVSASGESDARPRPATGGRLHEARAQDRLRGENDAASAQKLGQLRPFLAVCPPECMGQLCVFWANLTLLSLQFCGAVARQKQDGAPRPQLGCRRAPAPRHSPLPDAPWRSRAECGPVCQARRRLIPQ